MKLNVIIDFIHDREGLIHVIYKKSGTYHDFVVG